MQEDVRSLGFSDFNYILNERTPYNEVRFREMAFKSIPNLKETYNDPSRYLDFSRIIP